MSESTDAAAAAGTVRLTVAQALIHFLAVQYSERDGVEHKLFAGAFGIFGHGNVAGLGQALLQAELEDPDLLPYVLGRNEQAMVHSAVAYARQKDRLQTWAVTTSVGPGATNMVTGAALGLLLGGVYGIGLMVLRKAGRRSSIPLGPFMLGGAFLGLLLGGIGAG